MISSVVLPDCGDECALESVAGLTVHASTSRPARREGSEAHRGDRAVFRRGARRGRAAQRTCHIGDDATVADALDAIAARHGVALHKVLGACSFLVDSVAVRDRAMPLRPGAELDVLPPFAGG